MEPAWLLDRRRVRSAARAGLKLSRTGLRAGVVETDGDVMPPETGTPQGGTGAPVLAQGSRPEALALWVDRVVKAPWRGEALVCR
jgi:hypothetical protein